MDKDFIYNSLAGRGLRVAGWQVTDRRLKAVKISGCRGQNR
jgi:hypothetical protein